MPTSSAKIWDRTVPVLMLAMGASGPLVASNNRYVSALGVGWLITGSLWAIAILTRKNKSQYPKPVLIGITFALGAIIPLGIILPLSSRSHDSLPYCSDSSNSEASSLVSARNSSSHGPLVIDKVTAQELQSAGPLNCVKLDVTLRSNGPDTHIVDQAQIEILRIWNLPFSCNIGGKGGGSLPISKNYDASINLDHAPAAIPLNQIDEQLVGNDTDRFTILGRLEKTPAALSDETVTIVELRMDIYVDGQTVPTSSLPFIISATSRPDATNLLAVGSDANDPPQADSNIQVLRAIANTSAIESADVSQLARAAKSATKPLACPA